MSDTKSKTQSKQELAYQYIKNAIINNEFKPKSMLLEADLSISLGFSRTPIREALRRLSSEGFVEFIPEKGCFVSEISFKEFVDIFDVREVLEGMAARLCALRHLTVADKLDRVISNLQNYMDSKDIAKFMHEDMYFHEILIEVSGNVKLADFLKAINQQIDRIRLITMDDFERLRMSFGEHRQIMEAIKAGDPDLAEEKCRLHIRSIKDYLINKHYLTSDDYVLTKRTQM